MALADQNYSDLTISDDARLELGKVLILALVGIVFGWIALNAPPAPELGTIEDWHGNVRVTGPAQP